MTDTVLEIEALSFSIRGTPILRDISVRIGAGETWSIIGPNGAGKSTLLKCLMRIHIGWTGGVWLKGRNLASYAQRELARHMAYVPQPGGGEGFPYTVRQFVQMGRYAYAGPFGSAHEGDREAIETAIARTGIESFADRTLGTLSGGERQKVYIAAALAQSAEILLLDEPTAFLDYRHQAEVADILHAVRSETGAAVLTVTHDVNTAIVNGGQVLALRQGGVAWSGPSEELRCANRLEAIFDATFRFLDDPDTGLRLVAPQNAARRRNP